MKMRGYIVHGRSGLQFYETLTPEELQVYRERGIHFEAVFVNPFIDLMIETMQTGRGIATITMDPDSKSDDAIRMRIIDGGHFREDRLEDD